MGTEINWPLIIVPIITAILGFIFSYILLKARAKTDLEGKIQYKILEQDLSRIYEFLGKRGTLELINFFEKTPPSEVVEHLSAITRLDRHFIEQREYLEKIDRLLTSTLFNPVTSRIHNHIESNTLFIRRLKELEESKIYLREHITDIDEVLDVLKGEDSIFIESGSTLAYCMLQIIDKIKDLRIDLDTNEIRTLRVCTNNIGIYMMLLFEKHFDPVLLPGKPDNQYGATFADVTGYESSESKDVLDFLYENNVTALFTTASYLDIVYGPHVSSPENYAMKRILNEYANKHNYTNIMIISAGKINNSVSERKLDKGCILIFDGTHTLNVCESIETNNELLERTKNAWDQHLQKGNNYILTGSNDNALKKPILEGYRVAKRFIQEYPLQFSDGFLIKFRCEKN